MNHTSIPLLCNFIIRSVCFGRKGLNFKKRRKTHGLKKEDKRSGCLGESREQERNVINSYVQMSYIHIL